MLDLHHPPPRLVGAAAVRRVGADRSSSSTRCRRPTRPCCAPAATRTRTSSRSSTSSTGSTSRGTCSTGIYMQGPGPALRLRAQLPEQRRGPRGDLRAACRRRCRSRSAAPSSGWLVGIPIGILSAVKRGTLVERLTMGLALVAHLGPGLLARPRRDLPLLQGHRRRSRSSTPPATTSTRGRTSAQWFGVADACPGWCWRRRSPPSTRASCAPTSSTCSTRTTSARPAPRASRSGASSSATACARRSRRS